MTSSDRPNILLFFTDDHGAWALGAYGHREIQAPVLDALAAEGVRFANAFTPSPVCSPARACLLTGRTPSQVGIHDWLQEADPEIGDRDWLEDETTLPELLKGAGYVCGLSGKWHLGRSHRTPRGFDWCFGLPHDQGEHTGPYEYVLNGQPLTLSGNKARLITDFALTFLDEFLETAPPDAPFFLQVGYISTHSPYGGQEPELVARYDGATFVDLPPYRPHPWHKNEGFPQGDAYTPEDLTLRYKNYYAAVTDMDRNVGRLLEGLRRSGRLGNTLVLYTSDHGLTLGHHGFWGKGNSTRPLNMYETSLRVPLIVRPPGGGGGRVVTPRVVEHCVDHYDTFRALLEWAGVEPPPGDYPGQSYAPLVRGEALAWRDTRFGEYGDLRMVRTPHAKLVRRYPRGPDELFDLRNDPEERVNLAGRPEYAGLEGSLTTELESFYARYEDPAKRGLKVKALPYHNFSEAWRDGRREARGLQSY